MIDAMEASNSKKRRPRDSTITYSQFRRGTVAPHQIAEKSPILVVPVVFSREDLTQFAPQNLARWCARDGIHEVNFAGLLVVGQSVGDEVAKFFIKRVRGRKAFTEDDKRARNFSGVEVGFGDHAAVTDGGMFK